MKKGKRWRTLVLAIILIVALGATVVAGVLKNRLNRINRSDGYVYAETDPVSEDAEWGIGVEQGYENVDATSLDEFLTAWAKNDIQKLSDKNVLNVLLCGVDSRNGSATGGRSDAILLVSVNKKTKAVTLASFFRDSYTYIDLTGDPNRPRTTMDKINAAYSLGGPATLIDTIEANYKILIDGYISVDFNSFPKLINALGGVTLDVTKTEADYVNRTAPSMHHNFPVGSGVTLNGAQALVYSRIRHLGNGDVDRTARQRKIITAIMTAAKKASNGQALNAANHVIDGGYLSTSLSDRQLLSFLAAAFTEGWMDFEIRQVYHPTVEAAEATGIPTQKIKGSTWFWVVDFPRAAEALQRQLYGTTSISLALQGADRDDYLAKLFKEAGGSRGSAANQSGGMTTAPAHSGAHTAGSTAESAAQSASASESESWDGSETAAPETTDGATWPWWIPTRPGNDKTTEPEASAEEPTSEATQTASASSGVTEPAGGS
ncbi:MAG: LCP family protein [Oscillospiraceae bacterium]|jgi:LCP family protein required for cell wall assembly|nr:LCP family protein [Oscillospiraceae bacterium]